MSDFDNKIVISIKDGDGSEEQTILEKLESKGKAPHTCCRAGFCGSCAVTVLKGQAEHFGDPLGYHTEDQVLACISRLKSNDGEFGF